MKNETESKMERVKERVQKIEGYLREKGYSRKSPREWNNENVKVLFLTEVDIDEYSVNRGKDPLELLLKSKVEFFIYRLEHIRYVVLFDIMTDLNENKVEGQETKEKFIPKIGIFDLKENDLGSVDRYIKDISK